MAGTASLFANILQSAHMGALLDTECGAGSPPALDNTPAPFPQDMLQGPVLGHARSCCRTAGDIAARLTW